MCFSTQQPSAPVNKPAYAPEDANKHFESTKTDEDGNVTNLKPPTNEVKPTSVPTVKTTQNQIRM